MVQAVGIKDEVMEMIETISDLSYGWELLGILRVMYKLDFY